MILGVARLLRSRGRHVVTSAVEHPAVLEPCAALAAEGFRVTRVPVDEAGRVDPADVAAALTPETILVTVMHANNEVGTIEPIAEIARLARERGILVHTDAAQSVGQGPGGRRRARRRLPEPRRAQALRAQGRRRALRPLRAWSCPASSTAPPTSRVAGRAPRTCSRSSASGRRARSRRGTSRRTGATSQAMRDRLWAGLTREVAGPAAERQRRGGPAQHAQRRHRGRRGEHPARRDRGPPRRLRRRRLPRGRRRALHRPRGDARADALRDGHRALLGGARHDGERGRRGGADRGGRGPATPAGHGAVAVEASRATRSG